MSNGSEILVDQWNEFLKSAFREESYSSRVFFSVSLLLVFFASLIGNILTCIVIYNDKSMHTATNYYLFNLAVSDLLVTFPILIISYQVLVQQGYIVEFKNGVLSCKFFLCIHYLIVTLLWNNGILVMTALSIERYIAICFPMMLQITPVWKRVGKNICAIWIIAIAETLPLLWTVDIIDTGKVMTCLSVPSPTAKIIAIVSSLASFILPLSIMIFVYTMIAYKVKNNEKYNLKYTTVCKNGYRKKNVNKLVALTASFVVCWLPFLIVRIFIFFTDVSKLTHFHRWFVVIHKISMFNSWFTTVLNPLLFSLISIKFRKALKALWNRRIKKSNYQAKKNKTVATLQPSQHLVI